LLHGTSKSEDNYLFIVALKYIKAQDALRKASQSYASMGSNEQSFATLLAPLACCVI